MNRTIHEGLGVLEQLFSIVLEFDDELFVQAASPVALQHMPWLADRPRLTDAFEVARPKGIENCEDVLDRAGQLFLMSARDGSFALRGQIVAVDRDRAQVPVFCGSPWLFWLNSEKPDLQLGIKDFSPQDSQLDQLFFMTTEKNMVADLEGLTEELQRAKGKLELAQRSRDAFFAQMSHEMRTPLNGVVSALALLEPHELPERTRELLALIKSSSHNLMHVINYVLDVSKIEADNGASEAAPFSLDETLESVLEIVEARARERGLGLHLRVKPGLPNVYLGDGPRLRQTLLNLVMNALKFTDEGHVTIRVTDAEDRAPWIRIDVSDTGVGIPEGLQERIFEPFFSETHLGGVERDPGTGLGLDIVRRNVSFMGGELELASSPGGGSTFSVFLPLTPVEEMEEETIIEPEIVAEEGPLRGSVLLVDDNQTNLMLGTMLLQGLGLRVQGAASGEEAVEAVKKQCFCAVLMDISMPGIDGFEATRRIRDMPGRRKLPVLALTAYASSREQARAREVGMNDYLTKPVSRARLAQSLRRWLPGSEVPARPGGAGRETAPINDAVLEGLVSEIGAENYSRVAETFSKEARDRWQALATASSPARVAREAHSLISTCRSFGLEAMTESLASIETRARQGLNEDAASLEAVGQRLEDALNALSEWTPPQRGIACGMKP